MTPILKGPSVDASEAQAKATSAKVNIVAQRPAKGARDRLNAEFSMLGKSPSNSRISGLSMDSWHLCKHDSSSH